MPDMASLRLTEPPRLENLPLDILLIILTYLDTARSIAGVAATCRRLHGVVRESGWRGFVRSHFAGLSLPQNIPDEDWEGWARDLTWQSRGWDRRAFSVASFVQPPRKPQHRDARAQGQGTQFRAQTVPCHIMVDAKSRFEGNSHQETVAWGAGEDVVVRYRQLGRSLTRSEQWFSMEGAPLGFKSGKDDVTSISILDKLDRSDSGLLVGRASGSLQLLTLDSNGLGPVKMTFQPSPADDSRTQIEQKEVQSFDIDGHEDTLAVSTKDNVLLYPLNGSPSDQNGTEPAQVLPTEAISLRTDPKSRSFRLLRSLKFMGNGDIALGMTSSPEPLRYLTRTPTGLEITNAAKMQASDRCPASYLSHDRDHLQTVRGLLPLHAASVAGGHQGSVLLSSWDDGTVRLQDLRTPSALDTAYQDHFEVMTPVGPLAAYGTERFVAGSARSATLKIFDLRWPARRYHYTDALPCGGEPLAPTPRPPTVGDAAATPPWHPDVARCDHVAGRVCRCHALARADFHRPNCNLYLPLIHQASSPVYSLARPSDLSPTVYVGLAGELVKLGLRRDHQHHSQHGPHHHQQQQQQNNNNNNGGGSSNNQQDRRRRRGGNGNNNNNNNNNNQNGGGGDGWCSYCCGDEDTHLLNVAARRRDRQGHAAGYAYHESFMSLIETGDGLALPDVSRSQRVPEMRRQQARRAMPATVQRTRRLDDFWM